MESDNLRTASVYINNLLLSRGLLRNGQSIDFARPDGDNGGTEATMGSIMSVVNDLVLRRDRDSTQRESLSNTIRTLRADALRQTIDLERLSTKHAEAQRRLNLADATERALKTQLRSAESAAKGLKEEMGRMRVLVAQSRAQCANDVRKRERVIEGLKKHVADQGRARGSGKAPGVAVVTVVAGVGSEESVAAKMSTDESGYDLRMETNEFLTELAKGLSEENENLGALVRRSVETLRSLTGYEAEVGQEGGMVTRVDGGYDSITADMGAVIDHVRTLLTNPSFVPLEEVEIREEEIIRLRDGWEKMESRWKDAVQMLDGWRKRMARSGQTVNLEELKMGLRLSPLKVPGIDDAQNELVPVDEEGDTQADINAMDDSQVPKEADPEELDDLTEEESIFEDEDELPLQPSQTRSSRSVVGFIGSASSSPGQPPQLSPLREIAYPNKRREFTTIVEENTWDLANLSQSPRKTEVPASTATAMEDVDLVKPTSTTVNDNAHASSPRKISTSTTSRLPRPAASGPEQSPLTMATIAAKLAATEREADAARVRAKLKAAKLAAGVMSLQPPQPAVEAEADPVKESTAAAPRSEVGEKETATDADTGVGTRKRKAVGRLQGRAAARRRSTLSPWELESLILGGTAGLQ